MVFLHVTHPLSRDEVLFSAKTTDSVDEVAKTLAEIFNLKQRISRLCSDVRQLAAAGPVRDENELDGSSTPQRTGSPPVESARLTLEKTAADAESAISNSAAQLRQPLEMKTMEEHVRLLGGAVTIAYPMGLPKHDPVRMNLDGQENLSGLEGSKHILDPASATLWFCGKTMAREHTLSKYCSMEKATIKIKIQKKGLGAPASDPLVDADTQKKMMAMWHKKQQEEQRLAEDEETDTSYLSSSWANPGAFRSQMHGLGEVQWRPGSGL